MGCPLCRSENENVVFQNGFLRVVLVDEIPGYVRVITQKHIREFSDLSDEEAVSLALMIKKIEKAMLKTLKPHKINTLSLGNMVAHLHIHIIPRYENDPWWPGSVFCEKKRDFNYTGRGLEEFISALKELNER